LLRAWQPAAAKLAAKNLLRTAEGGEESKIDTFLRHYNTGRSDVDLFPCNDYNKFT